MAMTAQSGEQVKRALDAGIARLRRQMQDHVDRLRDLDDKVDELIARRGEALVELARHYVPDVSHETIRSTFIEIRDDLLDVLARKQKKQKELRDQEAAAETEIDRKEAELDGVTAELEEKVAQRERLEALLAERLHGSDEFKELSRRALEAEQELEQNEERVAEIKAEADRKLPSYDNSRLFKYLYDAGYGSGAYKKTGLTRRIDGWVAKLIDYPAARRGYQFLRVTPELMANEVERRRNAFNGLMEQVEAIEARVSDEVGLTEVLRQGQEIGARRDKLVDQLREGQEKLFKLQEDILQLDRPENEFHAQAVARMQNFLSNMSEARLRQESQVTPDRSDDAIVAEIVWLNDQLEEVDRRNATLKQQRSVWDHRLAGLQATLQRFRQREYDSRRSMFSSEFNMAALIDRYADGEIDQQQLWSAIEQSQQFVVYSPGPRSRGPFGGPLDSTFPGDLINSTASQVLFHVLTEVAGQAMRNSAHRSMQRRASHHRPRPTITRIPSPRPAPRRTVRRRGFTNGRGF